MQDGIYARFSTTRGEFTLKLEHEKTPLTVANFVGLAEGKIKNDSRKEGEAYYDGLSFHRVISGFMIQGGDPTGTGAGGPGYQFVDEIHPELSHDRKGILSMANAGPGTNGSQFFVTHGPTPHLDGKHTVFGSIVEGEQVVDDIQQGDKMETIAIIRQGTDAEAWDAAAIFNDKMGRQNEIAAASLRREEEKMAALTERFDKTDEGLFYQINSEGDGAFPQKGQTVAVHYQGQLMDGTVFDDSKERGEPIGFPLGMGRVIPGWDIGVSLLKVGSKASLIIPPALAYGASGAGGVIPPNAWLRFEVELVSAK
jgi:peptidyl-prolyl cis-trans isomerase A (cyclophilin A)